MPCCGVLCCPVWCGLIGCGVYIRVCQYFSKWSGVLGVGSLSWKLEAGSYNNSKIFVLIRMLNIH